MIVLKGQSYWRMLVAVRGTALESMWGRLTVTAVVACTVTYLDHIGQLPESNLTLIPFSLIGVALGIFLGFRNNTSYDRFWEGRKLWGRMVNTSRTLTRQVLNLIDAPPGTEPGGPEHVALRRELVYRVIAYVHMFRMHLRDEDALSDLAELLPEDEVAALAAESNRPAAISQRCGDRFRELYDQGQIHAYHLPVLEASLTEITNIQGGCERIKSTPIPASYTILIHRITASYAWALPFGIVEQVHGYTPVVVMLIAYAFFGLDAIGDEIEEPFGVDSSDLPLATLSRMIEVNLRQRLGETDLPAVLRPRNGLLL